MDAQTKIDSRELRQTLGAFVTGVTVVTTADATGRFHGVTANSFSSVSLDPPLVLWSQAVKAGSHKTFFEAPSFMVHILAEDQIELSNRFATPGRDKFEGLECDIGTNGMPVLRECSAWIECKVVSRLEGGDHTIYIGEIQTIRRSARRPLVFGGGQYLVADPHDLGTPPPGLGTTIQSQLHAVRLGTRAMSRLSKEFDETMTLAVWGSHGPTVMSWEPSSAPVSRHLPLGLVLPVTSTATGMALAAHLPAEATTRYVNAELAAAEAQTKVNWPATAEAWEHELAGVRQTGLAVRSPGAFYGADTIINALSAPVLDASGLAVLALTALGDAERFTTDIRRPFALALRATAQDLSRRLGHVPAGRASAPMSHSGAESVPAH